MRRPDIPAGTSVADAISGGQLQPRQIVQQDVIVGALHDEKSLTARYVTKQDLYAGQQVTAAMFVAVQRHRRHGRRSRTTTAPSQFAIDNEQILGGTLQAGDHVDLVGTYTVHPPDGSSDFDVSRIIVRDVRGAARRPQTDATTGKLPPRSDNPSVIL